MRPESTTDPAAHAKLLIEALRAGDTDARDLAARTPASPALLAALSVDPDPWMRVGAAECLAASPALLAALAHDGSALVRYTVVENPNTPPEVLTALRDDDDPDVREAVAGNHNTPPLSGLDAALAAPLPPVDPTVREGMPPGL